jgi:hypothetical protein
MSNQGFKGVPGVPDGWELVAIAKIDDLQWSISDAGEPYQWRGEKSGCVYPIIRKIEVPKQFRPFANAEEFLAHPLHAGFVDLGTGKYGRVQSFDDDFVSTVVGNEEEYVWSDAFVDLNFQDGTPFGVEVTSE